MTCVTGSTSAEEPEEIWWEINGERSLSSYSSITRRENGNLHFIADLRFNGYTFQCFANYGSNGIVPYQEQIVYIEGIELLLSISQLEFS